MTVPADTRRGPSSGAARAGGVVAAGKALPTAPEQAGGATAVGGGAEPFGATFPPVLAAAQSGAAWAYRRLFDWLGRPVAGYLRGQGAEDPDGMANDVFLRAFTELRGFSGDQHRFRSWVFTIAHNRLVDERRRHWRRPVIDDEALDDTAASEDTEAEALDRMGGEHVRRMLATLSSDQRDVLLLRVVGDLTVDQVAAILGKSAGAVKQLQRRGSAVLRGRLEHPASGMATGRRMRRNGDEPT